MTIISACRECGTLVEMTTEEAYTPIWCCEGFCRLCNTCFRKKKDKEKLKQST